MACIRFLWRRGPAGLRNLFRFCRNCGLYILRRALCVCEVGVVSLYPPRVVGTLDARLSKLLICHFLGLTTSLLISAVQTMPNPKS